VTANIKPYPAYKDSGVPWLGQVPEHWGVKRLKNVSRIIMGQSPASDTCFAEQTGMAFLQGCAEFGMVSPRPKQYCSDPPKVSPSGALLLSVRAPVGRVNFADQIYGIGRGLCAILPNNQVLETRFSSYALSASVSGLLIVATGSTYDAISTSDVGNHLLMLPPLAEQAAMVRYLDHVDRQVRHAIRARQQLIKLLTEQKQAIIQRAVTRGLDPNVRFKPSGVPWLGDVPEHWEVATLRRYLRPVDGIKIGPFGSQLKLDQMSQSGYKVYGQANVIANDFAVGSKFVDSEKYDELSTCEVRPDDLLVTMMGTSGRCVSVPQGAALGIMDSHLLRLRTGTRVDVNFAALVINDSSYVKEQIAVVGKGSIMLGLNSSMVKDIVLALPPLSEQAIVLRYLDGATANFDKAIDIAHREIGLLRGYRTRLIADVVTGKLDVRNVPVPDDETDVLPEEPEDIDDPDAMDQGDDITEENSDSSAEESA